MKKMIYNVMTDQTMASGDGRTIFTILKILSLLYGAIVECILFFYRIGFFRTHNFSKPVISVGNITWGGVGKTPLVELITSLLTEQKQKPVILIRGYMPKEVASSGKFFLSDEAKLLEESLPHVPVLAGKDRVKNAREALAKYHPDLFILDDGFQQWGIKRDLNIVVIDSTNPFGNGFLIPRGILREPKKALVRADVVVLTRTDLGEKALPEIKNVIFNVQPQCLIIESIHQAISLDDLWNIDKHHDLSFLQNKDIGAFCSIGNPASFRWQLERLGARVKMMTPFRDHHYYNTQDISDLIKDFQSQKIDTVITTQKDAVKLQTQQSLFVQSGLKIYYLKIKIQITHGKEDLAQRIFALL